MPGMIVHKSGIVLVGSGMAIIAGLVLITVGNQIVLDGVIQGEADVSIGEPLIVQGGFDPEDGQKGIFALQIMEFQDGVFHARVIDPHGTEIVSEEIGGESLEMEFDVTGDGEYRLVVEGTNSVQTHVFGAIGPLPDAGKKALGFVSVYVLLAGMAGLVGGGAYTLWKRRSV